jgi:hypothetical protein
MGEACYDAKTIKPKNSVKQIQISQFTWLAELASSEKTPHSLRASAEFFDSPYRRPADKDFSPVLQQGVKTFSLGDSSAGRMVRILSHGAPIVEISRCDGGNCEFRFCGRLKRKNCLDQQTAAQ